MSDMNPRGVKVEICGLTRYLLFTVNAIDEVQTHYGETIYEILRQMLNDREKQFEMTRTVLRILLDAEADRVKLLRGEELRRFTDEEIGMLLDVENILDVVVAIYQAYSISMPEASEEDDDPN